MSTAVLFNAADARPLGGVRGVIMAGGRSERMRATNGPVHKALVEVAGISLLEYNLTALFTAGIDDVVVVVSGTEPTIGTYLKDRGREIARRCGGRIETFIEPEPLGNIGVVAELSDGRADLLVVYVDNLTSIEPHRLLEHHRQARAAFTIASHTYALTNPFGELNIVCGEVKAYREKPVRKVRISSGTCVVGPAAAALVPKGRPVGASELFGAVTSGGLTVAAYEHEEPWIDVNDASALNAARALVRAQPGRFAC